MSHETIETQVEKWERQNKNGESLSVAALNQVIKSERVKNLTPLLIDRIYGLLFSEDESKDFKAVVVEKEKQGDLNQIICDALSEVVVVSKIDNNETFQNYGLDSVSAMRLSVILEKQLGKEVLPQCLIDYPSVKALSKYLTKNKQVVLN